MNEIHPLKWFKQRINELESEVNEIKAKNERREKLLSSLDTGLSIIEADFTISWANKKIREMFPEADPIGQVCHRFYELSHEPCEPCPTFQCFKSGRVHSLEKYNPAKDRWYGIISQPVKDSEGQVVSVLEGITDITERKEEEKKIQQERGFLKQLLETSPVAITLVDRDGHISMANSRAEEILGLERSNIFNRRYNDPQWDITDFEGNAYSEAQLPFQMVQKKAGPVYGVEHAIVLPDGKKVLLSINAAPVFDDESNFNGMISAIEDVTEQRKTEEALREKTLLLEQITDNMFDMVSLADLEGTYTFAGKSHERILGYTPEELVGKNVLDFVHSDDFPGTLEKFKNFLRTGGIEKVEYRYKHKDNYYLWFETIGELLVNENQAPKEILFSTRDITERKRAEDELKQTLDATTDGIWTWNFKTNELFFSPKYYSMLGYEPDAFPATFENWIDLIHPDDQEGATATAREYLKTKPDFYENEFRVRTKDGDYRWLNASGKVVERDAKGNAVYMIGSHEDFTERKKTEEERLKLGKRIQQTQKMESIGSLAGGIAHDFNNILFPILGISELLIDDSEPGTPEHESLKGIMDAGKRGKNLVRQILAIGRQSEQQPIPVQIQTVLKEVMKLIRSTIPANVNITKDIRKECGAVKADPTQIHQIAMNLITNASHALEDDVGEISVKLKEVKLETEDFISENLEPGRYAVLTVSDTGCGIADDMIENIFDPYFTTKEQGKGTGLGLSVVHGIVKNYGGDIKVYSELEKGTSFHVYLPVVTRTKGIEKAEENRSLPTGTERILVVDDEVPIIRLEEFLLRKLGYEVTSRTGSVDALEKFKMDPYAFDLVLTDMSMPNMTGEKLAREIISIRPEIPVILCTGFSERIDEQKAEAAGVKAFLMKPILNRVLAQTLRRVLDDAQNTV
ncbi:MAG: PAS domain S-box protein [Desulfobacteraceae bacterium]